MIKQVVSPFRSIGAFWQKWMTPRSANPEEAARERAIRVAFPLVFTIRIIYLIAQFETRGRPYLLATDMISEAVLAVIIIVPLILSLWALWTRRIDLAGAALMFTWVVTDLLGAFSQGYWIINVQLSLMFDVVLAALLLRQQWLMPYAFFLIVSFDLIVFSDNSFSNAPPVIDRELDIYKATVATIMSSFILLSTLVTNGAS